MDQNIEFEFHDSDEEGQVSTQPVQQVQTDQVQKPNIIFVAIINEFTHNRQFQLSRGDVIRGVEFIVKMRLKSNMSPMRSVDVKIEPILTTSILKACGQINVDEAIIPQLLQYSECLNFQDTKNGIQRSFDLKFLPYSQFSQCELIDQGKFEKEFIPIKPFAESARSVTIIVAVNKKDLQIYAIKKVKLTGNITWEKLFNKDIQNIREVNALSRLSHPNILRLFAWWLEYETVVKNQKNAKVYYLYEQTEYNTYLNCNDLLSFGVKYLSNLPPQVKRNQIKQIVKQILSGLSYIHNQGFFHRDLKIENILVTKDHTDQIVVRICDFDWSKPHLNDDGQRQNWTLQSNNAGSVLNVGYRAMRGAIYDASEELFQIGMLLLDLCHTLSNVQERANLHTNAKSRNYPDWLKQANEQEVLLIDALLQYTFKNVGELQNSNLYQNFDMPI